MDLQHKISLTMAKTSLSKFITDSNIFSIGEVGPEINSLTIPPKERTIPTLTITIEELLIVIKEHSPSDAQKFKTLIHNSKKKEKALLCIKYENLINKQLPIKDIIKELIPNFSNLITPIAKETITTTGQNSSEKQKVMSNQRAALIFKDALMIARNIPRFPVYRKILDLSTSLLITEDLALSLGITIPETMNVILNIASAGSSANSFPDHKTVSFPNDIGGSSQAAKGDLVNACFKFTGNKNLKPFFLSLGELLSEQFLIYGMSGDLADSIDKELQTKGKVLTPRQRGYACSYLQGSELLINSKEKELSDLNKLLSQNSINRKIKNETNN